MNKQFTNKTHAWNLDSQHRHQIQLRRKRYWQDRCNHPDECYVGSAKFIDYSKGIREATEPCIDVYVFTDQFDNKQHVCVRYSDRCPDYMGPGTVLDLLITAQKERHGTDHYSAAACVINHYMEIRASLRPSNP
jgi:hypothetical protein